MRIAVGSDHAGFDLKEEVKAFLVEGHHEVLDVGTYSKDPVDYPDYAEAVAAALREYRAERGIMLCGCCGRPEDIANGHRSGVGVVAWIVHDMASEKKRLL